MAIRALESRLERMSVNDENEPVNGGPSYQKPKVTPPKHLKKWYANHNIGLFVYCYVNFELERKYSIDLEPESFELAEDRHSK